MEQQVKKISLFKKFVIIAVAFIGLVSTTVIIQKQFYSSHVYDYNPMRDREFIINIFKQNWDWLVAGVSDTYSPEYTEYMLDNKASSRRSGKINDMTIKVLVENENVSEDPKLKKIKSVPVGFITYYPVGLYQAKILFLAVDKKYRGKGYADKLIHYAINELKKRGYNTVKLVTRVDNKAARHIYEKAGFKEYENDGRFVDYVLYLS